MQGMDTFTPADQALFEIDANVAKYGFHATAVFGGHDGPSWVYTVGLLETWSHPELIVFGLPPKVGYAGINAVVEDVAAGLTHTVGRGHPFELGGIRSCLIPVLAEYWRYPCDYLIGCPHYYGAKGSKVRLDAVQLVWSDENGRLPWDRGFQQRFAADQPLLDQPGQYTEPDDYYSCGSDGDCCQC